MAGGRADGRLDLIGGKAGVKRAYRAVLLKTHALPMMSMYANGMLSRDDLVLPHFLGIGAPKAGTTWLHHNLAAHPRLYLPAHKEMHFFTSRLYRGLAWYAKQFEAAGDRIPGEITPGYMALDTPRIELIRSVMPDVRLVLLIRNPIDRAWSHAVMKLAREQGRDVASVSDAEFEDHYRSDFSRARSDYLASIDRWTAVFGADQLLVRSHGQIKDQPRQLLVDVMHHIGAGTEIDWESLPMSQIIDRGLKGNQDVFGRTSTPPIPERHSEMLGDIYADEIKRAAHAFPDLAGSWSL